jgi:hypothetical protein
MKTLYTIAALLLSNSAIAQETNFYGPSGAYEGSAYSNSGSTNYYGPSGAYLGNSYSANGATNYYGSTGEYQGSSYGPAVGGYYE